MEGLDASTLRCLKGTVIDDDPLFQRLEGGGPLDNCPLDGWKGRHRFTTVETH